MRRDKSRKRWFADPEAIRVAEYNINTSRHRSQNRVKVEHRDPLGILDDLRRIETEILDEIDKPADAVREAVPQ